MKSNSFKQVLAFTLAAVVLTGCETMSSADETDADVVESEAAQEQQNNAETSGAPAEPEVSAEELAAQQAREAAEREQATLREIRTFYFDFDQYVVKSDSRAALTAHAAFLAANPSLNVVLEGHCDERGTKGYNLALGENRAKSVKQFLMVNGVSEAQIEVISYGEERPAELGQSEAAWSKNRRVFIEYK